jgi:hypothetical protein
VGAVLAELRRQKFEGNIAIEYAYNGNESVLDIAQSVGFVRDWQADRPDDDASAESMLVSLSGDPIVFDET